MNLNNNNQSQQQQPEEEIPFNIGGIVEKNVSKPLLPQPLGNKKAPATLKPMKKITTPGTSFPKPMANKRYTTREPVAEQETSTSSSSLGGFSQKPFNPNANPRQSQNPGVAAAPTKNERPIETSEFLQILRETMMKSGENNNNAPSAIKMDAGSQENLTETSTDQQQQTNSNSTMDTILRVARSSVPAQRAAALRTLQSRCEAYDEKRKNRRRHQEHDYFINAPADVATALFHPEESGPRLAMLSHLGYEDANQTVREAALLMWLTMLSSESRDDDILDTLVLAAITGAPTDDGDEKNNKDGEDEESEEQRKLDQEELRKRRLLAGGDTVPREMDDVDLRCGPTGVRIERKYFTLEAVSKLLREDPALGLARLGVYRTLLDRAVGRAADHDPSGSTLDTNIGGTTLLDNRSLWRAVAIASHESPTAAAYICEHKSFFFAFQSLIQATIGAHRGRNIPTTLVGSNLLPCVRDALIAVLTAIHSNSTRAHRMLPKLWSEGGIFLLLKYLELSLNEESNNKNHYSSKKTAKHVDPSSPQQQQPHHHHSARDHFVSRNSKNGKIISSSPNSIAANQCCAILCCIIRAAVRFGVPLSSESLPFEEAEEREKMEIQKIKEESSSKKNNKSVKFENNNNDQEVTQQEADKIIDPEVSTWFGEVYSFLVFTARHVGSFAVLEMLLINEITSEQNRKEAAEKKEKKLKPIEVRVVDKKEGEKDADEDEEEEEEEEEIRFVKTDLKKTIDEIVFPCVDKTLEKLLSGGYDGEEEADYDDENGDEEDVGLDATTGIHLLATWIGEGSLLAVFYGDREDGEVLFKKIEPLLEKSLKVMQHYIFSPSSSENISTSSSTTDCIVFDAFAHGLARFIDVVSKYYPKVRTRVAFHLQEIFSVLITSPSETSVFRVGGNNKNGNQAENDEEDILMKETKQMVAEMLNAQQQQELADDENSTSSSSLLSFSSKESSLSRLTRLSAVGELLRTAQWMMVASSDDVTSSNDKTRNLPSVLIRNEVVTCVALNLVRAAMRHRGAADTAVSAGLSVLLPMGENDSVAVDHLRENLANTLIEITSSSQPKVTASLPVPLRLDPLSAWILNPCLFVVNNNNVNSENSSSDNNNTRQAQIQKKQDEALALEVRVAWAQWLGDLVMKISTIAASVNIASASIQIQSLLPHPLSILTAAFLAGFCNEDPRENPPKFFTTSPVKRKVLENLAVASFTMCCGSQKSEDVPRCKEHLRQVRKESIETICRCADQNGDCLEMLFLLTVASLVRGNAETWSPLLAMWLERANWLYFTKEIISSSTPSSSSLSGLIRQCCTKETLSILTTTQETKQLQEIKKSSAGHPLLFTKDEREALQHSSSIIESLSSASQYLPPDSSAGPSSLPIFVKAALVCIAQLSAPCGDFVKNEILSTIEDRLWFGADDTVKLLQGQCLASLSNNEGDSVYKFWTTDL